MGFFSALFGGRKVEPQPAAEPYVLENHYNWGDDHFAAIINEANLPGYTVEAGVHPSVFDPSAHPKALPISFLIKKEGKPVLAVILMRQNQYRAMIARGTYWILEDRKIPYIRFFREMKNEHGYVLNRVRDHLS